MEDAKPQAAAAPCDEDLPIDRVTGVLLRVGVLTAAAVLVVGAVLFLYHHAWDANRDRTTFPDNPEKLRPRAVLAEARQGRGQAIIEIGLALLIATPILRVAFSAVAFAWRRDYVYVIIPLIVLAVLIAGLVTGQTG
jgi:uncharacterized membrane protein